MQLVGVADGGITDNLASFTTQLNALASAGAGVAELPYAESYYGVSGDLIIPSGIILRGQGSYLWKNLGPSTITAASNVGTSVTLTTNLGVPVNQRITVVGVSGGTWNDINGTWTVTSTGSGTITITVATAPTGVVNVASGWAGLASFGSAIGPTQTGTSWTNGVVCLTNYASALEHLTVIGINPAFASASAPAAIFVGNAAGSTNYAPRIRDCLGWGGTTAALNLTSGADDTFIIDSTFVNNQFTGTVAVGGSPAGCAINIVSAADIRFMGVQSFGGPWNIRGSDFVSVGGHISNVGSGQYPNLYLSSGTGGSFTGMTIDNGNNSILALVERHLGTWMFTSCRFQNGSTNSFPVIQDDITNDSASGIVLNNCHVSMSGSAPPVQFAALIASNGPTSNLNSTINNVMIEEAHTSTPIAIAGLGAVASLWAVDTTFTGTPGTLASLGTTLSLASTSGASATGGTGSIVCTHSGNPVSHSFTYTGVSGSNLTGCVFSAPTTDTVASAAPVTYSQTAYLPGVVRSINYGGVLQAEFPFQGGAAATILLTSNAAWPIPSGATQLLVTCVGGGGQGGGGGSSGTGIVTNGGGAGSAGVTSVQMVSVGNNTTLNVQVGTGGSGAGTGGSAGGNPGSQGGNGGTSTVTASGSPSWVVTAPGGNGGKGGLGNTNSGANGGGYGSPAGSAYGNVFAGCGGGSGPAGAGGMPVHGSAGGGAGGTSSTTSAGGSGGGAGTLASGGATGGGTSGSGTSGGAGQSAQSAAPNSGGGGGGGGGGTNNTGTGGAGGVGATGYVTIQVVG